MVSLPRAPASDDLNDLFGSAPEIELIFTFEGQSSTVALPDPETGNFIGTLRRYSADNAYWIKTSGATTVPIDIPSSGDPGFAPARDGEWDLVPVLSGKPLDDIPAGTEVDADAYLNNFRIAFGWTGTRWVRVNPDPYDEPDRLTDKDPAIEIGKGYWVLYPDFACSCP